jgi:ketosteroid isomerase-like protein
MGRATRFAALVVAGGFVVGCVAKGASPEQMIAAAEALDKQYIDALNKGDVNALMELYPNSPDIVSYGPDGARLQGWQAIKDYYAGFMASTPGAKYEFTSMHNRVMGDVVLGWGTFRGTIQGVKGPPTVIDGRYTDAKSSTSGKWGYVMEHGSLLPPPPATSVKK